MHTSLVRMALGIATIGFFATQAATRSLTRWLARPTRQARCSISASTLEDMKGARSGRRGHW